MYGKGSSKKFDVKKAEAARRLLAGGDPLTGDAAPFLDRAFHAAKLATAGHNVKVAWAKRQAREAKMAGLVPPPVDVQAGQRVCAADDAPPAQPKSWWQRAGEWVRQNVVQPAQQAVPRVMNWIDHHQKHIALGLGIAAGVAAIVLSGGAATPLVAAAWVAGSAAVAGGVAALGTVGLNAYFHRPLGTNVVRNLGYAAGAAAVTATVGFLLGGGVIQQGLYTVGNTATRLCLSRPTACARVGAALELWDKVEDIGLQVKLTIQTAQGDPRAAETALELQLEQLDNTPGNTTFREAYDAFVDAFRRHGDEVARLSAVALRHSEDVVEVAEDGMVYLRRGSEAAEEVAQEIADATGRPVWISPSRGAIYVSRPTEDGLEAATKLRAAVQSGADESAIQELIEDVARASTRGSGERVVLGAWQAGGGYIGEAVENGGVFFDTGDEVWQMVKASGVDPWKVNEAFLQRQLNARIERIDFVSGDVGGLLDKYAGIPDEDVPYRVRELRWLIENAEKFDYILTGNSWRLSSLP